MRTVTAALIAVAWIVAPGWAGAQENAYDVLGKALMPIANVFIVSGSGGITGTNAAGHGVVLDGHLIAASKIPPELQGEAIHLALMAPDKLLIQAPFERQMMTVCRNGGTLWATPGSQIQSLLDQVTAGDAQPPKKAGKVFGPLALPIPAKELVLLPLLFQVADAGTETVSGQPCRVLDVQLMAQLSKALHAQGWSARVWIDANYAITQLAVNGPNWSGAAAIDKLEFSDTLPDGTFDPQGTDVLKLTPDEFVGVMKELGQ